MSMGTWKKHKLKKGQRASRTRPPVNGWMGGRPEDNGYKHRG